MNLVAYLNAFIEAIGAVDFSVADPAFWNATFDVVVAKEHILRVPTMTLVLEILTK